MENYIKECQENAIRTSLILYHGRKDLPFSILAIIQSFLFNDVISMIYRWHKKQSLYELQSLVRSMSYSDMRPSTINTQIISFSKLLMQYSICSHCGNYRKLPVSFLNELSLQTIIYVYCFHST